MKYLNEESRECISDENLVFVDIYFDERTLLRQKKITVQCGKLVSNFKVDNIKLANYYNPNYSMLLCYYSYTVS